MRYAMIDDQRSEPQKKLTGTCPACGSEVIAKCGTQRIWHWAHRGVRSCDSWWEPETEWHRKWKNEFPDTWQEVIQYDNATGEKHIADVLTEKGATLEFQHSHLRPEERAAREAFYKNLVWVVDGSRLKRDLPRFVEGVHRFSRFPLRGVYITALPEKAFPRDWLACAAPVVFDFKEAADATNERPHIGNDLWCLLPARIGGYAVLLRLSRDVFVQWAHQNPTPIPVRAYLERISQKLMEQRKKALAAAKARPRYRVRYVAPRSTKPWTPKKTSRSRRRF